MKLSHKQEGPRAAGPRAGVGSGDGARTGHWSREEGKKLVGSDGERSKGGGDASQSPHPGDPGGLCSQTNPKS